MFSCGVEDRLLLIDLRLRMLFGMSVGDGDRGGAQADTLFMRLRVGRAPRHG